MAGRLMLLVFGVAACSSSVIFIKLSTTDPVLLAGYRCLLASALMGPLFVREWKRLPAGEGGKLIRQTWIPGAILALHFISWILGARRTDSANATLIVNFVPMVMPIVLFALIRERVNRRETAGTAIAFAGVLVLGAADYRFRPEHFAGDLLCFLSMWLYAFYLAYGRMNRHFPSIWLYVIPVYFFSGWISVGAALALGRWPEVPSGPEWLWILGLAVFPTVLGHSIMNYSMRFFRGQLVGIVNVGQFISASVLAYLFLREVPATAFYPAAALVLTGAGVVVAGLRRRGQIQPPVADA